LRNHALICYRNQPALSNDGEVSCSSQSRTQLEPLLGFELLAFPLFFHYVCKMVSIVYFTDQGYKPAQDLKFEAVPLQNGNHGNNNQQSQNGGNLQVGTPQFK